MDTKIVIMNIFRIYLQCFRHLKLVCKLAKLTNFDVALPIFLSSYSNQLASDPD